MNMKIYAIVESEELVRITFTDRGKAEAFAEDNCEPSNWYIVECDLVLTTYAN